MLLPSHRDDDNILPVLRVFVVVSVHVFQYEFVFNIMMLVHPILQHSTYFHACKVNMLLLLVYYKIALTYMMLRIKSILFGICHKFVTSM